MFKGSSTGVNEGASSCYSCSPGKHSLGDGIINICQNCLKGSYSSTRASVCIECEKGTYASEDQASSCEKCAAGRSTLGLGNASICVDCLTGEYSTIRSSLCSKCSMGKYSSVQGQADDCIPCSAGSYSNETGSTECLKCSNGTFLETSGQSSCLSCEVCRRLKTILALFFLVTSCFLYFFSSQNNHICCVPLSE